LVGLFVHTPMDSQTGGKTEAIGLLHLKPDGIRAL
jgi:hypothetical protein